jgi:cysteine desulfurase
MMPFLSEEWGNPSSSYRFGSKLKGVIERAREQIADLIGAKSTREIIFTSGGTESNNTAIHSAVMAQPEKRHIVTSQVEHSSVLTYCHYLEKYHGYRVTYLPVDSEGLLSMGDLENAIQTDTAVVSLMWANNETGVLFPVAEIAALCRTRGVLFHCDAVQAVGKIDVNLGILPCDYLSLTGHKIGAAKGIGALYIHRAAPFVPMLHGGHQERSRRGGTENVASIAGLGAAASIALDKLPHYSSGVRTMRDKLEEGVLNMIPGTELNGHKELRLANTSNIAFSGMESEAILILLDQAGVFASSGSACLADSPEPSHVIAAMKSGVKARQSVRFSLSACTPPEAYEAVPRILHSIRAGLLELAK